MASVAHGLIEHDVEHFRPKSSVRAWPPTPEKRAQLNYLFSTGDDFPEGYYLLAYNLLNYAMACKPCNSSLKSNYFPIAGSRINQQDDPRNLADEQPLLIYPVGDLDVDPAELIGFDGRVPVPVSDNISSYPFQRARVTIDFFELDTREELLQERSLLIYSLFLALKESEKGSSKAIRYTQILLSHNKPHTNCLRCFAHLFSHNRNRAEAIAERELLFLESLSR